MRLLDISDFPKVKFREVADPGSERYAILSHVWDKDAEDHSPQEPSFQDLSPIVLAAGRLPAKGSCFEKLFSFCEVAHKARFKLVWADMCCIDKTSSAELCEAITSMYHWYQCAEVCYAYLGDVSSPGASFPFPIPLEEFRKSEWFERGWTLQELIAPRSVVFYSKDWRVLGSKCGDLREVIHDITRVNIDVLTHKCLPDAVSGAHRMSWAAKRLTSRVEDRAYSLMGLFGVQIPVIYGEREYAFVRLQEEILRRTSDPTLFAWGTPIPWNTLGLSYASSKPKQQSGLDQSQALLPEINYQSSDHTEEIHVRARLGDLSHTHSDDGYLFAPSPTVYDYEEEPPASEDSAGPSQAFKTFSSAADMSRSRTFMRGDGPDSMNLVPPNMIKMHGAVIPVTLEGRAAQRDGYTAVAVDQRPYYLLPLGCTIPEGPIALILSPGSDLSSRHYEYWVIGTYVAELGRFCRIVVLPSSTPERSPESLDDEFARALQGKPQQWANIILPSGIPMSSRSLFAEGGTLRADPGTLDIHLAGWCKSALKRSGFSIEETFAAPDPEARPEYKLVLIPKIRGHPFYPLVNRGSEATALQFHITFTYCSHPDSELSEARVVALSGNVKCLSHSTETSPPGGCCCPGGVESHIPVGRPHPVNAQSQLWALNGGVAVGSRMFSGRASNDDEDRTDFGLTIRLFPSPLSASPDASNTTARSHILEVECSISDLPGQTSVQAQPEEHSSDSTHRSRFFQLRTHLHRVSTHVTRLLGRERSTTGGGVGGSQSRTRTRAR